MLLRSTFYNIKIARIITYYTLNLVESKVFIIASTSLSDIAKLIDF